MFFFKVNSSKRMDLYIWLSRRLLHDSFQIILHQKFIDGLNEKLQIRVTMICNNCKCRGQIQEVCFQYQCQLLEGAQPLICYFCRQIGHLAYQCPTRLQTGNKHPNIPGHPLNQGNHWVSTVSLGQWINKALRKPEQLPD